jgi:hypothetical protein
MKVKVHNDNPKSISFETNNGLGNPIELDFTLYNKDGIADHVEIMLEDSVGSWRDCNPWFILPKENLIQLKNWLNENITDEKTS